MPDVSVAIAAWNAAACIDEAITSALCQADVSLEVIVVDDASTDQTAAAVAAINDARVRYLRLGCNVGPSGARNAALEIARGEWIAVLDADDAMLPNRLARLVVIARANRLDIVADNLWVNRMAEKDAARELLIAEALDDRLYMLELTEYLLGNRLFRRQRGYGYLKPLFRRAFLRDSGIRYDESLRIGEDFLLVAEALAVGARYGRHASAGYAYAAHPHSISHRLSLANANAMIEADRRFLARFGNTLSATERQAARTHLRSLEDGAAFIAMVSDIKQRRVADVLLQACRHPGAVRHFSMPARAALGRLLDGIGPMARRERAVGRRPA